jgi:hypothetical protein
MSGVLVEVSSRRFAIPHECPCCGAVPDAELVIPVTGKRATRTSATSMDLPSCKRCNKHVTAMEAAGVASAATLLAGLVAAIAATIALGPIGRCAIPVAIALAFVLVTRRRRAAELTRGPSCAAAGKAVAYLGWSGTTTAFELASPTYAARFAEQNEKILHAPSPRLRTLLEGHARARIAVPSAAAPVADPPSTIPAWIAKLGQATGPAGRRHLMVRALGAFSDDASRAQLVEAVAKIDLEPTYAKLAKASSLEDRARVLAEAIARVTADNLPEPVQDHELRELEKKLNSLA